MSRDRARVGEQESTEVLRDRVRAWWTTVLAGQIEGAHPVHGTNISARLDGTALVVSGTVPSEEDRREIESEVEHLRGNGVDSVRNELSVEPESRAEPGLLVQTLMSVFENEEQAGFAEGYLEGHAHVKPEAMKVVAPPSEGSRRDAVRVTLPRTYWEDAEKALDAGRSLLIVTVDETEAFKARELLDEETRSLETVVLPPELAASGREAHGRLDRRPQDEVAKRVDRRAGAARERSLRGEEAVHDR
jgi:hypothetical protein